VAPLEPPGRSGHPGAAVAPLEPPGRSDYAAVFALGAGAILLALVIDLTLGGDDTRH
jgi:hypothetical protein